MGKYWAIIIICLGSMKLHFSTLFPPNSIIVRCLSKQRILSVFHYTARFMLFVCQNKSFHQARFKSIAALCCLSGLDTKKQMKEFLLNSSRHGLNNSLYQKLSAEYDHEKKFLLYFNRSGPRGNPARHD